MKPTKLFLKSSISVQLLNVKKHDFSAMMHKVLRSSGIANATKTTSSNAFVYLLLIVFVCLKIGPFTEEWEASSERKENEMFTTSIVNGSTKVAHIISRAICTV